MDERSDDENTKTDEDGGGKRVTGRNEMLKTTEE